MTVSGQPALRLAIAFLLLVCSGCVQVNASSPPPSAAERVYAFSTASEFQRQLDAMRWNYQTRATYEHNGLSLHLSNTFRSRLFLADQQARNIQDENDLRFALQNRMSSLWSVAAEASSYSFTTTDLRQHTAQAGLVLHHPATPAQLTVLGGLMNDQRSDRSDQGFSGQLRIQTEPLATTSLTVRPTAGMHYASISPREYANHFFRTDTRYQIDDFVILADLALSRGTRESYQPGSFFNRNLTNIIESVRNDSTLVDLTLQFPLAGQTDVRIDLYSLGITRRVESRPISEEFDQTIYDTRSSRQELQLRAMADRTVRTGRLSAGFQFGYTNRGSRLINTLNLREDQILLRNEVLRNSNFDQTRLELFTDNRFRLSERNEITVHARTGILRYDTPELNLDDRDEQHHMLLISTRHRFSPWFDLSVRAGAEATHFVYLSSARSIENNWRRTIRLAPQIRWQPADRLTLRNSLLIRANYTVEDFEIEGRPKNDQSSREYAIRTEADYTLATGWIIEATVSRSELRIGRLYWNTFEETPTDTLVTYDSELMIVHQRGRHRIGLGGRFYTRRDYLPQTTLTAQATTANGDPLPLRRTAPGTQIMHQFGPTVDIHLAFRSGNQLLIRGWYQRQQTRRRLYTTYPEEFSALFRSAERHQTVRIYPNLEIRAIIAF